MVYLAVTMYLSLIIHNLTYYHFLLISSQATILINMLHFYEHTVYFCLDSIEALNFEYFICVVRFLLSVLF